MFEPISHNLQTAKEQSSQMAERFSTQLHQTVGKGVTSAMSDSFQSWLTTHPTIAWIVNHPLWALGILLIAIFLFWGLLRAIAQFIEQVWIAILRLPLILLQRLLGLGKGAYQRAIAGTKELSKELPAEPETNVEQRLTHLLNRLETLQQEEVELLQEVKTLLATDHHTQTTADKIL